MRGELFDRLFAGAGDRLVGRDINALDLGRIMQRLQRDQHLNSRAIGISDDATLLELRDRLGVNLGHDERNVFVVTKLRGVVDHDAPGSRRFRCIDSRDLAARREQADIGIGKIKGVDVDHRHLFAIELDRFTERAVARKRKQLSDREFALLEHLDHRVAHESGCTEYRYFPLPSHFLESPGCEFVMTGVRDCTSAFCARWRIQ